MNDMKKVVKMIEESLLKLPTPVNISYWWNYGSLLGMFLFIQILSGFFLSMHYCSNISVAFNSVIHIMQNVSGGWLMHNIHINGATFFFMCMYIHMARGIYYGSFKLVHVWMIGVSIYFISMGTAFLGYVLPWGQMSFWGATVITNLVSTIPYIGNMVVMWIWGGFSINNSTLNRFFTFHFILPFMILMMVILHLYFLHFSGSSNPLGLNSDYSKVSFHIYFTLKDLLGFILISSVFLIIILQYPYMFGDPDNFIPANSMVTPVHIQPEWYFLFAYAILRSIPSKLGGVIALLMSIMVLYFLSLYKSLIQSLGFYPLSQFIYWVFVNIFILLTWAGAQVIEIPYVVISQFLSILYFMFFLGLVFLNKINLFILFK